MFMNPSLPPMPDALMAVIAGLQADDTGCVVCTCRRYHKHATGPVGIALLVELAHAHCHGLEGHKMVIKIEGFR